MYSIRRISFPRWISLRSQLNPGDSGNRPGDYSTKVSRSTNHSIFKLGQFGLGARSLAGLGVEFADRRQVRGGGGVQLFQTPG